MPRSLRTILLACVIAVVLPAAAQAAPTQTMIFDAPRDLLDPAHRPAAMDELSSLGVKHVRVVLYWKNVAPSPDERRRPSVDLADPASYDWAQYDDAIEAARARGWRVLLTVTTPGPKWAMRDRDDYVTRPRASEFQRFMTAVSRRFGGQVSQWAVLNEPNHPDFLGPQYGKDKAPLSPRIYRQLFLAADRALRATGNGDDTLLIGETAPRGTGRVVAPLTFLRSALCLSSSYKRSRRCARLNADGWAHHAYTTKSGPFFVPPGKDDVTIGVLSRLTRALDRAGNAGAIRKRMPVYLTEFGIQSSPDRFTGVSLQRQPEYRDISERLAYGNPRVRAFSQYLLRDDMPRDGVPASQRYGGFESGLRFASGREKPSLSAFRLPVAALRSGKGVSLWGLVRPATGPTTVEIRVQDPGSRSFRRLKTVRTDSRGYFTTRTDLRKGRRYRLRWQGFEGAPVRVYRRP